MKTVSFTVVIAPKESPEDFDLYEIKYLAKSKQRVASVVKQFNNAFYDALGEVRNKYPGTWDLTQVIRRLEKRGYTIRHFDGADHSLFY